MEDWNEASEIRHLLENILPGNWKRRGEDEEKKRAKKRVAVRIMAAEDTHAGIMEFFRRNLGEPCTWRYLETPWGKGCCASTTWSGGAGSR